MLCKIKYLLLGLVWLSGISGLFWGNYLGDIQVFDPNAPYSETQTQQREGKVLQLLLTEQILKKQDSAVYLHILSDRCQCFQYAKQFVSESISGNSDNSYNANNGDGTDKNVKTDNHWLVGDHQTLNQFSKDTVNSSNSIVLNNTQYKALQSLVPATPALIIIRNQKIQYLGPHSDGNLCGEGESFIALYKNNFAAGYEQPFYNLEQNGCFCRA